MFVFFWLPYDVKYSSENFRTAFSLAVSQFPEENSIHIGQEALFSPASEEFAYQFYNHNNQSVPDKDKLSKVNKYLISPDIFKPLQDKLYSNNLVWKLLMTEVYQPLVDEIGSILNNISEKYDIAGVVTWCNTPSLTLAAESRGLPVIHNEMGPLRRPYYEHTAYFDFMGVNGNTEVVSRLEKLKKTNDYQYIKDRSLSAETILLLLAQPAALNDIKRAVSTEYDFGIPLQVEDDSNIIAYGNGFNNFELIRLMRNLSDNILIRKHPWGYVDYREIDKNAVATSPITFIKLCDCIATTNSSMAYEAVLLNKKAMIFGDSPFKILSQIESTIDASNDELITNINFISFCYLIPFRFLYDYDYYCWRLSEPSEREIFNFHLNFYLNNKGIMLDSVEDMNDRTLNHLLINNNDFMCSAKKLSLKDKVGNVISLGPVYGAKYIIQRVKTHLSREK